MQNNFYIPLNSHNTITHLKAAVDLNNFIYDAFTVTTANIVVNGVTYPTVGTVVLNTFVESVSGSGDAAFAGRPIGLPYNSATSATTYNIGSQPTFIGMGGVNN